MLHRYDLLGLLVVLGAGGCGGPAREFGPVAGKVTLNGKPLAGVLVRFYPLSESNIQAPIASAITDEMGIYELSVGEGKPGALVGPAIAVVSRPVRDRATLPKVPEAPIPLKYTVATKSPLRFEVKSGAGQTIDLNLNDD